MESKLAETPLAKLHVAAGAKMVPFAGWNMPVQYTEGIIAEHNHTREHVSLFDICHMGEFRVKGPGALEALDGILARPVIDQKIGICRYNFLLNPDGGVMDDLIVYRMDEDEFFIVVNAGTRYSDADQFRTNLPNEITFTDESDITAKLDLQGPESADVLAGLGLEVSELPGYFRWKKVEINSIPCLLSRTGYTGELGFELYFAADKAAEMWNLLLSCEPVKPAGLGARDTLRLEMGYALYGHELDDKTTPIEAGMGGMLKLEDYSDRVFIGSNALRNGTPKKQLVAITLESRRAARAGAAIMDTEENPIGIVTSGAFSPSTGTAVAMGYVENIFNLSDGDSVLLDAGRAKLEGKICSLPFYHGGSVRKKL